VEKPAPTAIAVHPGSSYVGQLDNPTSAMRSVGTQVEYGGGLD
jgi:hypothetical protein